MYNQDEKVRNMSEVSDISSIIQESLLLGSVSKNGQSDKLQKVQDQIKNLPSVLDKDTLTKLKNGDYEVSLKEYTNMNTYNTMMSALYGNRSANTFQNTLNLITKSPEDELATAKTFVQTMKDNGMSTKTAVKTFAALQKYSLMSSFGNYNFVKAKV